MVFMSNQTRQSIIEVAKGKGFAVQLKADGTDLYQKNLVFRSGKFGATPIYIHKSRGIDSKSGELKYLKVAVKPDLFNPKLVNPSVGIEESISNKSKVNRHHSSNYVGFPADFVGKKEPYGKCYQVRSLDALGILFAGLIVDKV